MFLNAPSARAHQYDMTPTGHPERQAPTPLPTVLYLLGTLLCALGTAAIRDTRLPSGAETLEDAWYVAIGMVVGPSLGLIVAAVAKLVNPGISFARWVFWITCSVTVVGALGAWER